MFDRIERKVLAGERLNPEEGLYLLTDADVMSMGRLAQWVRHQKHPGNRVTYIIDSNPNYTNVCVADCLFCAFYRRPGDKEAYTLSVEQVMEKIKKAADQGATTVLLQGGLESRASPRLLHGADPRNAQTLPASHPALLSPPAKC